MLYITDAKIEEMLKEDVPYIDLTTLLLGIGQTKGKMVFFTREKAVLCGTEEVIRLCSKLNLKVNSFLPSGSPLEKDQVFLEVEGNAESLHMAWKVSLNILDNCSGIATRTKVLVDRAKQINPKVSIYTTRKSFPGTKELSIKGVVAGGGYPHRLGLSETVLVFKQHVDFLGGKEILIEKIKEMKKNASEKKIIIEAEAMDEAMQYCQAGADGIQFDKITPELLRDGVEHIRAEFPYIILLAAGGINEKNIEDYASTGVDALITTSVYYGKPVDMSVRMMK